MTETNGPTSSDKVDRRILHPATAAWILPWIVPVVTGFYLKFALLTQSGFSITAASFGAANGFGFWEKLAFFRADVIVAAAGGIVLLLIGTILPRRFRFPFVTAFSATVTLALYAQLRAFRVVGQFLSLRMFWTAISWGVHEPRAYASYLGIERPPFILALAVALSLCVWRALSGRRHRIEPEKLPRVRLTTGVATLDLILYCLIAALAVPLLPAVPANPYRSSILVRALSAYWEEEQELPTREFADLDAPALLERYREINHAPGPNGNDLYWGKARGSNVLFFVLETTPARFLPPAASMDDLPNMRRLREKSFVGLSHYTTFPRTHEALFSLLSSWYPLDADSAFGEEHVGLHMPGMMATLSSKGYYTAIYSPMQGGAMPDEEMFKDLGIQRQVYAPDATAPKPGKLRHKWEQDRVARDLATLNLMKQDLDRQMSSRRNFAAVFLPQISHLPYPDVPEIIHEQSLVKRARGVIELEDEWLGQILGVLQEHNQLNNTIIVIVGDHGIRTHKEDPEFVPGMIDEYSFHVPLLIYAPRALHHSVTIPWLTSHIDVSPTVLDLLGIKRRMAFEEGSPIWDEPLTHRTTYFFADWVFGADGYYSNGRFYMRSVMSGGAYENSRLHFEISNIVPRNSATLTQLTTSLACMEALQRVAAARFAPRGRVRDHIFAGPTLLGEHEARQ